jgi:hypothetical protein
MDNVRGLCSNYADKDIFNMDETGLFWKMSPDRTLATEAQSGGKKSKDQTSIQALDKLGRDNTQERMATARQRTIEVFFTVRGASLEEKT